MLTLDGKEFEWPAERDIGPLFNVTCVNHQFLRWSTKHPFYRNIHYLGIAGDVKITKDNARYAFSECPCPYEDLRVIGKEIR